MLIDDLASNDAIAIELGARLRDARIDLLLTQDDLAKRAGVSKRTIANAERGTDLTRGSLMSILRALGLLSRMELLVSAREARPSDLAKQARPRQRVRTPKAAKRDSTWEWGDE